jgi:hypothetical protein
MRGEQRAAVRPLPDQADEARPVCGAPGEFGGGRSGAEVEAHRATIRDVPELVRPPAVRMNARRIVVAGTLLWFAPFVALLPFYGWLGDHQHRIWLWTCLAGWILGLLGLAIMVRHRRAGRTD